MQMNRMDTSIIQPGVEFIKESMLDQGQVLVDNAQTSGL